MCPGIHKTRQSAIIHPILVYLERYKTFVFILEVKKPIHETTASFIRTKPSN